MDNLELLIRSVRRRGLLNTLRYVYHELLFDIRYGTETKPELANHDSTAYDNKKSIAPCQGANPWLVGKCFNELRRLGVCLERSTFLDIGSGKGRVMIMAVLAGFHKVIGIELDPALCRTAEQNLGTAPSQLNNQRYTVLNADAREYTLPADVNVVFMYNPFGSSALHAVIRNILRSASASNRPIYVIYVNPICADVFDEYGVAIAGKLSDEAVIYKVGK